MERKIGSTIAPQSVARWETQRVLWEDQVPGLLCEDELLGKKKVIRSTIQCVVHMQTHVIGLPFKNGIRLG
jgi:hypothetical protein